MDNKISWDSFKSISHLKDYGSNPVLKVIRKIHLLQEIKDPDNQAVHYVSRRAFKKWTHAEGLELFKAKISLGEIANEIQVRRSTHLADVTQNLKFPDSVPPFVRKWVKEQIEKEAPQLFTEKKLLELDDHAEVNNHLVLEWNEKGYLEKIELNDEPLSWKEEMPTLNWPGDLSSLKISPQDKRFIHSYINEHFSSWKGLKTPFKVKKGSGGLPLSFYVIPDKEGNVERLVLLPKVVIGRGGEREIKRGHDLITGRKVARKTITRLEELEAQKTMAGKGGAEILAEVQSHKEGMGSVIKVMEPEYQGSLDRLFDAGLTKEEIRNIAQQLLKQLAAFHEGKAGFLHAYHGDIKPENVLYLEASASEIEVALSDFGAANVVEGYQGTPKYFSPDFAEVLATPGIPLNQRSIYLNIYRQEHAQKGDVWAMGLSLVEILTGGRKLECIESKWGPDDGQFDFFRNLKGLKQEEVDQELKALQEKWHSDSPLWDVVRKMLVVVPEERCTAAEALALLP